ncbi:MAG: DUF2490 domain-containing protein [Ferruginibacter sp.]|nr:DUF2490 domain-containing protein [Ferruginibacter sp.]
MKKFLLVVLIFLHAGIVATAQTTKRTEHLKQLWFAYNNQTRFSDKWGMWADLHARTKEKFATNFSQSILRFGLTYYVTDNTKLTAGLAYVSIYPDGNRQITQPELRLWQQVQWHTKHGQNKMMQWFRLEERFRRKLQNDSTLADGNNFNFRLRYNIWYDIPLSKRGLQPKTVSLVVNDEVHINFGKEIVNNYFDQNRLFVGLKYQFTEQTNLQVGYMNLFQQLAAGNRYRNINAVRFFYFQNLDLRKKDK